GAVAAESLVLRGLLGVGALNFFEGGGQRGRLHADGGSLGPGAAPRAHGAAKGLIHGANSYGRAGLRASASRISPFETEYCRQRLASGKPFFPFGCRMATVWRAFQRLESCRFAAIEARGTVR